MLIAPPLHFCGHSQKTSSASPGSQRSSSPPLNAHDAVVQAWQDVTSGGSYQGASMAASQHATSRNASIKTGSQNLIHKLFAANSHSLSAIKDKMKQLSVSKRGKVDEIQFYRSQDPYFDLGNFGRVPVTLDGQVWPTSEQYYQSRKFPKNPQLREKIRQCKSPMTAYHLAHKHQAEVRPDWEGVKEDVMYDAVVEKFRQNRDARMLLLSTGTLRLVESSPTDAYWGTGPDGKGKNRLGAMLERVRAKLKLEYPNYTEELKQMDRLQPLPNQDGCYLITPYPKALWPLVAKLKTLKSGTEVYKTLEKATQQIPGFINNGNNRYTYQGFQFLDTTNLSQANHLEVLKRAKQLNLKSVPKLVENIQIDPHYCVLITELPYQATHRNLTPHLDDDPRIPATERKAFLREMELLATHSKDSKGQLQTGYYIPDSQSGPSALMVQPEQKKLYLSSLESAVAIPEKQKRAAIANLKQQLDA